MFPFSNEWENRKASYSLKGTHKFDDYFECLNNWLGEKFTRWSITIFKLHPSADVSNDLRCRILFSLTPPVSDMWGLSRCHQFKVEDRKSIHFSRTFAPARWHQISLSLCAQKNMRTRGEWQKIVRLPFKNFHIFSFSRFSIRAVSVKKGKEEDWNGTFRNSFEFTIYRGRQPVSNSVTAVLTFTSTMKKFNNDEVVYVDF